MPCDRSLAIVRGIEINPIFEIFNYRCDRMGENNGNDVPDLENEIASIDEIQPPKCLLDL
jgi:hypothetical protein